MAHPLQDTKSSTLTGGSASSGVSTGATSLGASLFLSSISNSSASMYWTLKQRSQSFAQCPVFLQCRQVSGVALVFRAVSMSIGTGLPGDRLEWAKRSQDGLGYRQRAGSSQRELGHRVVGERRGTPRLPRGSDPSKLRDRTRLPGPYPKAFHMSFPRGASRFSSRGLSGT